MPHRQLRYARRPPRSRRRTHLRRVRRYTLGTVFLAVLFWGALTYRSDHHTFAWTRTVRVVVVVLVDATFPQNGTRSPKRSGLVENQRCVERLVSRGDASKHTLRHVEEWVNGEHRRYTGGDRRAVTITGRGPVRLYTPPPLPPARGATFFARARQTHRFLGYFKNIARDGKVSAGDHDVTVFVYLYDPAVDERRVTYRGQSSVASRRDQLAVVFAPLLERRRPSICTLIAHELCHTFGATDKYEAGRSVVPRGLAEPDLRPLYPQRKAEIMAAGIPESPEQERSVDGLDRRAVNRFTAREMGWIP